MSKYKWYLNRIFIDGLSGMAIGLFGTLIIGTIIQQLGMLIGGSAGAYLIVVGRMASLLTGAGIGAGTAYKLKEGPLVLVSSTVAGLVGAYAGKIIAGTVIVEDAVHIMPPGEPMGAFIASYIAIEAGRVVSGRTKLDIVLTPLVGISAGSAAGLLVGPSISECMTAVGELINWATMQHPFLMGVIVSVLMGMLLTLPISSAALSIMLKLSGLAAGAATVGCCANMIGFAVASYRENRTGGLLAQGVGTSMLQVPNIVRKPVIWVPAIVSSAILGPISTMIFHMENNAAGAGMGTCGLVGQINTYITMTAVESPVVVLIKITALHFVFPALISLFCAEYLRKCEIIQVGDMKLEL